MRAAPLCAVGGFRTFFRMAEDSDLQFRLSGSCRVWYQPQERYLYRIHSQSVTHLARQSEQRFYDEAAVRFAR